MLTRGREAQARASADTVLSPLPRGFVRAVLLLLPADTRLRCSEVSRAWRALLADTTLFSSLNLSVRSGLSRFSLPLLRAAVAKADWQLRALDVTGQRIGGNQGPPDFRLLLEVVAANKATLAELRGNAEEVWSVDVVRAVLSPVLQILEASVSIADRQVARSMLRNEPPFQVLWLQRIKMSGGIDTPPADMVALCSDLRCHASLDNLFLETFALDTAVVMGAVVDRAFRSACAN